MLKFNAPGETGNICSLTQYFRNGEIWGVNAEQFEIDEQEAEQQISSQNVELTIMGSLNSYLEFQRDVNKIKPPYTVEAGLYGVKGWILIHPDLTFRRDAKFHPNSFELRRVLNSADLDVQRKFLIEFFELMHKQTGYPRPQKLYGFPPD